MTAHSKLGPYSYQKVVKVLSKCGFRAVRQRGSHIVFKGYCGGSQRTVVVPKHEEIAVGTLRGILFQAGLTIEEFVNLVGKN